MRSLSCLLNKPGYSSDEKNSQTDITMLDGNLNKKWAFSGMDIFVSISGKNPFEMKEDRICLFDFYDHYYEIDYDGKLLDDGASSDNTLKYHSEQ